MSPGCGLGKELWRDSASADAWGFQMLDFHDQQSHRAASGIRDHVSDMGLP